jgi:excinuclease UvrABC nuclease subunit
LKEILQKFTDVNLLNARIEVPISKGIYLWTTHNDDIVYIGIALGKNGLRHRICSQHLNPEYLEFRETKHNSKDSFQLEHAIVKTRSDNQVKKGIDKSSFRKSIGRKLSIEPGTGTCKYIYENLKLKVFAHDDATFVKELEKNLIAKLQPIFNSTHK